MRLPARFSFLFEFTEAEVQGAEGLAGMYSRLVGFNLRPLSTRPLFKASKEGLSDLVGSSGVERWEGIRGFCQRDPREPASHFSHIRRKLVEDRFLFCLPPLSRRRTNFGRHISSGLGVVKGSDSSQGTQEAACPGFLGSLGHVSGVGSWRKGLRSGLERRDV